MNTCLRCEHKASDHNDAGTLIPGGRYVEGMLMVDDGEMFCYARVPLKEGEEPKIMGWGYNRPCGCSWDGPGTRRP